MSKLIIKNDLNTELSIEHLDGNGAMSLGSKDFKYIRDTIKDMSDISPNDGDVVMVKGYNEINDGGGGLFVYSSNEPKSNHNGGTVIDSSKTFPDDWTNQTELTDWFTGYNTTNGCWKRICGKEINVKWFGAKGDNSTNDYHSFINALNSSTILYIPFAEYFIGDKIIIEDRPNIKIYSKEYPIIKKPSAITSEDDATFLFDNCPGSIISGLDLRPADTDTIYVLRRWDSDGNWIPDDNFACTTIGSHPLVEKWDESKYGFYGHQFGNEPQPLRDWINLSSQNAIYSTNVSPRIIMKNADRYTIEKMRGSMLLLEMRNTSNSIIRNNAFLAGKGTWGSIRIDCQEQEDYGIDNLIENNMITYGSYSAIVVSRTKRTRIINNTIYRPGESGVKTDQNIGNYYSRRNYDCHIEANNINQTCYDGIDFMTDNITNNATDAPRTGDYGYDVYPPYKLPTNHIITNNVIIGSHGSGLWGDGSNILINGNIVKDGLIGGIKLRCSNSLINANEVINNNKTNAVGNHQINSIGITTNDFPDNIAENVVITNNKIAITDNTITTGDKIWVAGKNFRLVNNIGEGTQGGFNIASGIDNIKYMNIYDDNLVKYNLDALVKTTLTNIDGTDVMSGIQLYDNGDRGEISTSTVESGGQYHWKLYASQGLIGYVLTDTEDIKILTDDTTKSVIINDVSASGDGKIILSNLPTSDPGAEGQLWNDSGTVKISAG